MCEVESVEHFKELVESSESKLVLIDCYASWCGPCVALHPTLLKMWNDYTSANERVTIATCDMEKYGKEIQALFPENGMDVTKNGCLPLFLVVRFKSLTNHISGVDAPQLLTYIQTNIPEKKNMED